jgi:hypothetical protein
LSYVFFVYKHPTCALSERTSTKPDNRRIGEETRQTNRQTYVYIQIDRAVDIEERINMVNQKLNLPTINEENPVTTYMGHTVGYRNCKHFQ